MAEITLTVTNRAITLPQTVPQQIAETEYIDKVKFNCDSEYTGYTLVAVFKNGEHGKTYPVTVPADRSAVDIDPRALKRAGILYIGMFGVNGLKTLPTLWAPAIEIKDGTDVGADADTEETPALVARVTALETAVDSLEDTVDDLGYTVEALEEEVVTLDNAVDELTDTVEGLADDVEELTETVEGKQDTITDLDTIRNGAALGATALQSVPTATSSTIGGGKANNYLGIMTTDGTSEFMIYKATNDNITARSNPYRPITPANMDTAFRTCITAPAQELTDEQKAAACATIGATREKWEGWSVVETWTQGNRISVDFSGFHELIFIARGTCARNHSLAVRYNGDTGFSSLVYWFLRSGNYSRVIGFEDNYIGLVPNALNKVSTDRNANVFTNSDVSNAYLRLGKSVSDMLELELQNDMTDEDFSVEIYAR